VQTVFQINYLYWD